MNRAVTPPAFKYLVAAIGNPGRGDDGAGPLTAAILQDKVTADVALTVCSGDLTALLEDWEGYDAVFCVDASAPGLHPGRIDRIDDVVTLPRIPAFPSSHAFGLAETIALGAALQNLPKFLVVYAIEGVAFGPGAAMTPSVAAACAQVAKMIQLELDILRNGKPER